MLPWRPATSYLHLDGLQVPPPYYVPQHDAAIMGRTEQQSAVMGMGLEDKHLPCMALRGGEGRGGEGRGGEGRGGEGRGGEGR